MQVESVLYRHPAVKVTWVGMYAACRDRNTEPNEILFAFSSPALMRLDYH